MLRGIGVDNVRSCFCKLLTSNVESIKFYQVFPWAFVIQSPIANIKKTFFSFPLVKSLLGSVCNNNCYLFKLPDPYVGFPYKRSGFAMN